MRLHANIVKHASLVRCKRRCHQNKIAGFYQGGCFSLAHCSLRSVLLTYRNRHQSRWGKGLNRIRAATRPALLPRPHARVAFISLLLENPTRITNRVFLWHITIDEMEADWRTALLPKILHRPAAQLKASAVRKRHNAHVWSAVCSKKGELKWVFSCWQTVILWDCCTHAPCDLAALTVGC